MTNTPKPARDPLAEIDECLWRGRCQVTSFRADAGSDQVDVDERNCTSWEGWRDAGGGRYTRAEARAQYKALLGWTVKRP